MTMNSLIRSIRHIPVKSLALAVSAVIGCHALAHLDEYESAPPRQKQSQREPERGPTVRTANDPILSEGVPVISVDIWHDDEKRRGDPDQCIGDYTEAKQGDEV